MRLNLSIATLLGILLLGGMGLAQSTFAVSIVQLSPTRRTELQQLYHQGQKAYRDRQYQSAEATWKQGLQITREAQDKKGSAVFLNSLANLYKRRGQVKLAIEYYTRTLKVVTQLPNRRYEAETLMNLAGLYDQKNAHQTAIDYYQSALPIHRSRQDQTSELNALIGIGANHYLLKQYRGAIHYGKLALPIYRQQQDALGEARTLAIIGSAYRQLRQYGQSIHYLETSIPLYQRVQNQLGEARAMYQLGQVHLQRRESYQAIKRFEQAAKRYHALSNPRHHAKTLTQIADIYHQLERHQVAIRYQRQALLLYQGINDSAGMTIVLNDLGLSYQAHAQYAKAITYYQQSRKLAKTTSDQNSEANALMNIGNSAYFLARYQQATDSHQQALKLFRQVGNQRGTANALMNLGNTAYFLAQKPKAIKYYQQALPIFRTLQDQTGEANLLNNLSLLDQAENAKKHAQQALKLYRTTQNQAGEATALMNLGIIDRRQGRYAPAIDHYQQALSIARRINDRHREAQVLNNLGVAYRNLGQPELAIVTYQNALSLFQSINVRRGEGGLLHNIGLLLEQQQQPALAIIFYKQSVNVREDIRADIPALDHDTQTSYIQSVADTYRRLANLLIEQGRIGEAQQVLERLKIQELNDFTQTVRSAETIKPVELNQQEITIQNKYNKLISFGNRFYTCEQQRCADFQQLKTDYQSLSKEFYAFVETAKQQLKADRLQQVNQATADFRQSAQRIVEDHPNSILIYPLVLPNQTRILWSTKGGVFSKAATCAIGQKALSQKISQFRIFLSRVTDEARLKAIGKELYDCLIKPLEPELTASQIQHLIFVPDRMTNYMPMAAVYDGNQYLIERFATSNILSASKTDTRDQLPRQSQSIKILGLGLSEQRPGYDALPYVEKELDQIVKTNAEDQQGIFGGLQFLNQAFDRRALEDNLRDRQILHIATHGEFNPTNPRSSFLLLGNGQPYAIPDIQTIRELRNVHLVVLSACDTGLGGRDNLGLEVSGMSSFFLGDANKAKAVLASLWKVNDESTSILMQQFYQGLAQGQRKTAALRQAQLFMLKQTPNNPVDAPEPNLTHPYYWAPFILMGNGL
ncbi:tetratricopeptide repeat protein [filamentous cyanobacterium LEGE 11480]|uniref:Tetratricopeptide repeat protein n=1 Tax=Romeriopsis navalis LEGE 11480 TaxID=2777977 RepID=A0A928VN25_9CYAN|nr:tetratricopeptide repeat protein [Romeriopsis navalis]MBE9031566.1 tetratricopeptide repeat protein [Romeriopsis navalis LEGE 11480]